MHTRADPQRKHTAHKSGAPFNGIGSFGGFPERRTENTAPSIDGRLRACAPAHCAPARGSAVSILSAREKRLERPVERQYRREKNVSKCLASTVAETTNTAGRHFPGSDAFEWLGLFNSRAGGPRRARTAGSMAGQGPFVTLRGRRALCVRDF